MPERPELKVTVYSDYICPFCYVGNYRLQRLRENYDLKINWRLIEIHPETSEMGEPISELDYPSDTWELMMSGLVEAAREESIPLAMPEFITNSKSALLLAEACKTQGKDTFYSLHDTLFKSYFVDQLNIGDKNILRAIAQDCGVPADIIDSAWTDSGYEQCLLENYDSAREFNIQSVPSFIFGDKILTGVVKTEVFQQTAKELVAKNHS